MSDRPPEDDHYLRRELYALATKDAAVFDFLQAGSLDGIWYWDLEKPENEWMSPKFWQVLGQDPQRMPHSPAAWKELIHPDDLALALENFERHKRDPEYPYDQIVRYRHCDGSTVFVRCRGLMIRRDDGTPIRMLGAHTELAPLKQSMEALAERTTALEDANRELQEFASLVSHDLSAPLRSIAGFSQLLAQRYRDQLDTNADDWIDRIVRSVDTMQRMLDGLVAYTRVQATDRSFRVVAMDEVLRETLDRLDDSIRSEDARIDAGSLPEVVGDRHQLVQLLQALIGNAIKFRGEAAPHVEIRAEPTNRYWTILVRDNGIGFDPALKDRAFEVMTRLHRDPKLPGSGMGLAVCRRIVERHGGHIDVETAPGEGSCFSFTLPGKNS